MKKLTPILLVAVLFLGCKKKTDEADRTQRKVTYTFSPNGASSQIMYKSIEKGYQVSNGPITDAYLAIDEVVIGDKTVLQMSTKLSVPASYEIKIAYNGKQIGYTSSIKTDATGKYLLLEKTFVKEDFE